VIHPLPDLVRAHAIATPTRIAVTAGSRGYSYGQLWKAAVSFAASIRQCGFKPGDRVGILLANCPEAVIACYGTWIAGGIAVPLNVQARSRELVPWLHHCEPAVLVCDPDNPDLAPALRVQPLSQMRVVARDALQIASDHAQDGAGGDVPHAGIDPAQETAPAMILYTSGTTGSPKGVTLSHRNLASNTASIIRYLELTATDSTVTVLPFYYAYGCSVLNTHLAVGGRVVLERNLVFPHAVVDTITRERVTGFSGVPSTFSLLLSRVDLARRDLSSLRYLTQAGGPMPIATTRRLLAALPHARLYVMYGQTEATARLTALPPEMLDRKIGSVGRAIEGVEIEIRPECRDSIGAPVGEVWVRGPNVMLGYWRDQVRTSEALHEGWLKTGDMGRLDDEGFLFLHGRRTDMIKVGAHRVYPNDVEEAISEMPGVAEAAVVGIEDEMLGEVVKAYVVRSQTHHVDATSVQAHCRERLASYKVPKQVVFVESLPKSASGKIMRRALTDCFSAAEEQ
jgi:acyl-CoA synthetase (AMP-forming)/AMP-acid ligase II